MYNQSFIEPIHFLYLNIYTSYVVLTTASLSWRISDHGKGDLRCLNHLDRLLMT